MKKVIILVIVILIILSTTIYAKYFQAINLEGTAEILKSVINVENDEKILIENEIKSPLEFNFKISNFKENEINKAEMFYIIEIENTLKKDDIDIKLFNEDKELELKNLKTTKISLGKEKNTKEYKLLVNLKDNNKLNGKINIKIEVIQDKK